MDIQEYLKHKARIKKLCEKAALGFLKEDVNLVKDSLTGVDNIVDDKK